MALPVEVESKRVRAGSSHVASGKTVGTTLTVLLAANPGRVRATIQASNLNTEYVFITFGDGGLTTLTGIGLAPGQHYEIDPDAWTGQKVVGICASGGMVVHVSEST